MTTHRYTIIEHFLLFAMVLPTPTNYDMNSPISQTDYFDLQCLVKYKTTLKYSYAMSKRFASGDSR